MSILSIIIFIIQFQTVSCLTIYTDQTLHYHDDFRYNLNEETEKRKNAEMLYNKTKEQLSRKDEQYTQYVIILNRAG